MSKVYKVVRKSQIGQDWQYFSSTPTPMQVEYHVGYKARSVFGPLFAWDTLQNALKYMRYNTKNLAVFEAEAELFPVPVDRTPYFGVNMKDAYYFWSNVRLEGKVSLSYLNTAHVQEGTVFCDNLKLIREIADDELNLALVQVVTEEASKRMITILDNLKNAKNEAEIASHKADFNFAVTFLRRSLGDWVNAQDSLQAG